MVSIPNPKSKAKERSSVSDATVVSNAISEVEEVLGPEEDDIDRESSEAEQGSVTELSST